jgi:diguanylate cyclase (GGDEF)-like protein
MNTETTATHQRARKALTTLLADGLEPTPQNFALYFELDQGEGLVQQTLDTLSGTFLEHQELGKALSELRESARMLGKESRPFRHQLQRIESSKSGWLEKLAQRRRALREELHALDAAQEAQQHQILQARKLKNQQTVLWSELEKQLPEAVRPAWQALREQVEAREAVIAEIERGQIQAMAIAARLGILFDVLEQNLPSGESIADVDPLTQALNRRGFFRRLNQNSAVTGALLAIDLDRFRDLNERYGHPGGDRVLQFSADILRHYCRSNDIFSRFGGEEFMVFLPNCSAEVAHKRAEAMRTGLATAHCRLEDGRIPAVTGSIGVALWDRSQEDFEAAYTKVDKALYAAKNRGRNRVVAAWELQA